MTIPALPYLQPAKDWWRRIAEAVNAILSQPQIIGQILYPQTSSEISASVTPANYAYPPGDVRRYGAKGDGVADDTTAIQSAINSLPVQGGTVYVPQGNFKVTSTITIGNGSSSSASTRYGVFIIGQTAQSLAAVFTGYPSPSGSQILWAGPSGGTIFQINGPLQGWGLQNLTLNAQSTAAIGLNVLSAQFGDCRNLAILTCTQAGIYSTVVSAVPSGVGNIDSLHNKYKGIYIIVPNVSGAKGVVFTGTTQGNSDYNVVDDLWITFTPPSVSVYGIYFQASDNIRLRNVHMNNGNSTFTSALVFDYTINNVWPADNYVEAIDFGGGTPIIANIGTPGPGATPNRVLAISSTNGAMPNPKLTNLLWENTSVPVLAQPARAIGAVYQNTTGRMLFISISISVPTATNVQIVSDSSPTPIAIVAQADNNDGGTSRVALFTMVPPNSYYKIVAPGGTVATWSEWS